MVGDFSVRVIRELRGALDEEQERELTADQCDWLHREGELRLRLRDGGRVCGARRGIRSAPRPMRYILPIAGCRGG